MTLTLTSEVPPLVADDSGTVRVRGTRVTLDLIVHSHLRGMTPEQIAENFESVELADIYAVVGYYLRHRTQVDEYLAVRDAEAAELRNRTEREQRPFPSRAELLARRDAVEEL